MSNTWPQTAGKQATTAARKNDVFLPSRPDPDPAPGAGPEVRALAAGQRRGDPRDVEGGSNLGSLAGA